MKNILTIDEQYHVKAMCIIAKIDKEIADEYAADVLAFESSWFYKTCSLIYDATAIGFSIALVIVMYLIFTW